MHAIKGVRKLIESDPADASAQILASLVLALENEGSFQISNPCYPDFDKFKLALKIIDDWWLGRYTCGKVRLFDLSFQLASLPPAELGKPALPQ